MKKLVLTLALVFGVLAANAQYFVGGQLGLLYDDASENTMITIAPEFGYAFNDTWTVAGMVILIWTISIRFISLRMPVGIFGKKIS